MRPVVYTRVAAASFAAGSLFAIIHRAASGEYFGFTHAHNVTIDALLATVWAASAVAAMVGRSTRTILVMMAGAATSVVHGFMFSVATSSRGPYGVGIPFLAAAVLQFYCIAHVGPEFEARQRAPRAWPFAWHMPRLDSLWARRVA